jgi:hypothetical protein
MALSPRVRLPRYGTAPGGPRTAAMSVAVYLMSIVCICMHAVLLAWQQPPAQKPATAVAPLDAAVRDALTQYSTALESLDADQVKKIHPSVDSEGLKRAFREMRELKVTIDSIKVLSADGATARVSCRVTQALTPRVGTKQNNTVTRVLRLRKQEAAWLIDGFER